VKFSKAKVAEDGKTPQRVIAISAFGYKNQCRHRSPVRRHPREQRHQRLSLCRGAASQCANRGNTGSTVWADSAYRSKTKEYWLEKNGYMSYIHHKKPKGR
jgi:hypothetical protein